MSLARSVLLGIALNETMKDVELNLSGNALGAGGSQVLEDCLPTVANISSLDLSDNGYSRYYFRLARVCNCNSN